MNPKLVGSAAALVGAALYGVSFPLTKPLISDGNKLILAGMFYLSQAVVFSIVRLARPARPERRLGGGDWRWMLGSAVAGGIVAPALWLYGQALVPAHVGALLSPTEVLFTTLLAVGLFGERLRGWEYAAIALIMAGGAAVGFQPGETRMDGLGTALVIASFLMWGLDNNCATRIAERDPLQIALVKGYIGGVFNIGLGLTLAQSMAWDPKLWATVCAIGVACFGGSFVMILLAMRLMGASRSIALFGSNPAFGVAASWILLAEQPTAWALGGGLVMLLGVYALLSLQARAAAPSR